MVTIEIDGVQYQAEAGESLLPVCLALGLDLTYFCWHPSLGSVGACRQCAVMQYQSPEDKKGRLAMACMTPVTDGMRISLQAEQARQFRSDNIVNLIQGKLMVTIEIDGVKYAGANSFAQGDLSRPTSESRRS